MNALSRIARHRFTWPLVALVALLVADTVKTSTFLSVRVQDGHLFGGPIDILRNGAPLLLVSLGMTLVIATRGIDLSVGAVLAIAGAVACDMIASSGSPGSLGTVLTACAVACAICIVLGFANGFLVAVVGIQPIIATLILMTAGRGIAMLITEGQITTVNSAPFAKIGGGFWFGVPAAVVIAGVIFGLVAVGTRRTALGVLVESVGINPEASRLAGVRSMSILLAVYAASGRDPRRRARRDPAERRPVLADRHADRHARHPDPHHLGDHPGHLGVGDAVLQGPRRHRRVPPAVPGRPAAAAGTTTGDRAPPGHRRPGGGRRHPARDGSRQARGTVPRG